MTNSRKKYTAKAKYETVKEVLTTDTTVSEMCKRKEIAGSMYYKWQDQFFKGAYAIFESGNSIADLDAYVKSKTFKKDEEITKLKNVIAELSAENIELKKNFSD